MREVHFCLNVHFLIDLNNFNTLVQFFIFPWFKLPKAEVVKCEKNGKNHFKFNNNLQLNWSKLLEHVLQKFFHEFLKTVQGVAL